MNLLSSTFQRAVIIYLITQCQARIPVLLKKMIKGSVLMALCCLLQTVFGQPGRNNFKHPGMMQNRTSLEQMKAAVLAGKQPWKTAFDNLKATTPLFYEVHAVTHLSQGAYGADDQGGKELMKSAALAYDAALLWYITRDQRYADESAGILNEWSAKLWDLDGNNAKLLAGLSGHYFLNAAEILRYSNSGWRSADIVRFKRFILMVYYPLINCFFPEANGNWDASMINTMLCIGVFCDDHRIFDQAVQQFMYGSGNGGITKYIYPGGQPQEATRDWGHVQLGLGEFAKAAQTAWTQGVDLYGLAGNRLALGFEYASKYLLGNDVPAYGSISDRERTSLRDIYENIYNHYHYKAKLEMPYTLRMVNRTRPTSGSVLLVSLNEPLAATGKISWLPEPGEQVLHSGALIDRHRKSGVNIIRVAAGESVQQAVDRCPYHAEVLLLKGVHNLNAPLQLSSGITLSGEGEETILHLNAEMKGAAIINRSAAIHDVMLEDFVIEGAAKVKESEDPNDSRRARAYQHAPFRAGISLLGKSDSVMKNINFIHITIRNCTGDGLNVAGALGLKIYGCDFSDNGGSVSPGKGLHHNLRLSHVNDAEIVNTRLDTSPWGSGLDLSECENISLTGNEMERNKFNGIRGINVSRIKADGNLIEGNDGSGIWISAAEGKSTGSLSYNVCQFNGYRGITTNQTTIKLLGNNIAHNRLP